MATARLKESNGSIPCPYLLQCGGFTRCRLQSCRGSCATLSANKFGSHLRGRLSRCMIILPLFSSLYSMTLFHRFRMMRSSERNQCHTQHGTPSHLSRPEDVNEHCLAQRLVRATSFISNSLLSQCRTQTHPPVTCGRVTFL